MPGFDGTGPQGRGPMTGRARGYCVLRELEGQSNHLQGFAGIQGTPVDVEASEEKEVTDILRGYGIGPISVRPPVGRPMVYPATGYADPILATGVRLVPAYGSTPYGYRQPWWVRCFGKPVLGRGFGCGRGWGRGRGRGRFGFPR